MIVVDASAWVMSIMDVGERGRAARDVLGEHSEWALPSQAPMEVLRTLQRYEQAGHLSTRIATSLAHQVMVTPVRSAPPNAAVLSWVWIHRAALSMYDAPYVHLAAELGAPLVTFDGRLARAAADLGVVTIVPA